MTTYTKGLIFDIAFHVVDICKVTVKKKHIISFYRYLFFFLPKVSLGKDPPLNPCGNDMAEAFCHVLWE